MNKEELKYRTKQFALRIFKLADALPNTPAGRTIANQIVRCSSSVAANYRASCRSRSTAEFISKLGTVAEEADESAFWLEMIMEAELLEMRLVEALYIEANELTAIFISSIITAKKNKNLKSNPHTRGANAKLNKSKSKIPNPKS
ncbi:four helix bundle protein [bacterium]|nr:four helix bundle protein [bacterium]